MKLDHTDIINAPVEVVYSLVKERLAEIAPYLPSISKIERVSTTPLGGGQTQVINHWFAKVELPALVKKFLSEDLFSWQDIATWTDSQQQVTYELSSTYGKDFFSARGTNSFKATGKNATELHLSCDINIHADRVPGIPRLMAKTVVPTIEKIIEKMLQPNMTSLGIGIKAYLAAQKKL